MYVQAVIHQLQIAVKTVLDMYEVMEEESLDQKPIPEKRSIRELSSHLSILMKADLLIMEGNSKEGMNLFYKNSTPHTIEEMKKVLVSGFEDLSQKYQSYSIEELNEIKASYWGVPYSRFEWLLQIMAHFYHHRAQLHMFLSESKNMDNINLFE